MLSLRNLSPKQVPVPLALLILVCFSQAAMAQPLDLTRYQKSADITGFIDKTETSPSDDQVLKEAPVQLSLQFPIQSRLVKFTLRTDSRDWIDIEFRYDPRASTQYVMQLPKLADAIYYTADWAVLSSNDTLLRGSFSFAFGANAQRPSVTQATQQLLLEQRYGDPTIRYVSPPATEIIIDRDPPQFDPPFTIKLNSDQSRKPIDL
jgi:methionine-rich copper-binding protein CopC